MKSLCISVLIAVVSSAFSAAALGEMVFVDRRYNPIASSGTLELRDENADVVTTYTSSHTTMPVGIGLSPDSSTLYMADSGKRVWAYNTSTGDVIGGPALFTLTNTSMGMAVDPDGNIYVAAYASSYVGYIAKYDIDEKKVYNTWGSPVQSGSYTHAGDIEYYGGKIYGELGHASGPKGVWGWDIATGTATLLGNTNAADYKFQGLAFAPDGTLYTSGYDGIVRSWSPSNNYATPTILVDIGRRLTDIDYFDGKLYVANQAFDPSGTDLGDAEIRVIDLSETIPTADVWATFPADSGKDWYPAYLYVVSEIPEPSTLALLAAGLVGLLAYAWRKRK